jgi:dihydrofolate synthase/folylpolyglutamate synthase
MHLSTMNEWISWIESIHISEIELGLDRVKIVGARLDLLTPSCPVIIVGGTNGKGSTVAGLEAIYLAAGYRTGAFTSPYLFKLNEEVRINGMMTSDEAFCAAFAKIEATRGEVSLTPFEFYTLAALSIFQTHTLDVLILEVGLGGRLDAVNIIDADVSVVTSISIDHVNYLGNTREKIAHEKAGIFRSNKPAVCGDFDPPETLTAHASAIHTPLYCQAKDFRFQENHYDWSWYCITQQEHSPLTYEHLPLNSLLIQNMSTVLMATTLLQSRLPVSRAAIDKGLVSVTLSGRMQVVKGEVTEIYDVSHNPAAVALLADRLTKIPCAGKTYGVFSMLADKDIGESLNNIRENIDVWYVAPLQTKRAASAEQLQQAFQHAAVNAVNMLPTIQAAYDNAINVARPGDRIIVFGSFHTVADVLSYNRKL